MSSYDRLFFIKTSQTTSEKIEIHTAVKLIVDNANVYYLNTAIPTAGTIQLNRFACNDFSQFDIRTITPFSPSEAAGGFFTVDFESLYFVKTTNTASGFVEVFITRK
ncbi:MAG: hypothetical protein L6R41_006643 [Letrouitia leprolyta]|nr:MAG: hypothetical protein L6R41_006643 [Letrouitia leprolyta]